MHYVLSVDNADWVKRERERQILHVRGSGQGSSRFGFRLWGLDPPGQGEGRATSLCAEVARTLRCAGPAGGSLSSSRSRAERDGAAGLWRRVRGTQAPLPHTPAFAVRRMDGAGSPEQQGLRVRAELAGISPDTSVAL